MGCRFGFWVWVMGLLIWVWGLGYGVVDLGLGYGGGNGGACGGLSICGLVVEGLWWVADLGFGW